MADYMPDLEKLRQSRYRDKLIVLRGREEGPELAREPVVSFAEALRIPLWDVPGGHVGYVTHAREFADSLPGVF